MPTTGAGFHARSVGTTRTESNAVFFVDEYCVMYLFSGRNTEAFLLLRRKGAPT